MRAHYFYYRALNRKGILTLTIEELPLHYNYSLCLIKEILLFFNINCLSFASSLKICWHLINKLILQMSWGLHSCSHSTLFLTRNQPALLQLPQVFGTIEFYVQKRRSLIPQIQCSISGCGPCWLLLGSPLSCLSLPVICRRGRNGQMQTGSRVTNWAFISECLVYLQEFLKNGLALCRRQRTPAQKVWG